MARYTGPKCKLCEKYEERLYLKGDRCYSDKCPMSKTSARKSFRKQKSEYAKHLSEKQKLRILFGIGERQMKKIFKTVSRKKGLKGQNFLKALCMRMDNVVYRLGFASSLQQARQLVGHGFVLANGRVCDISSRELKIGEAVALSESGKKLEAVKKSLEHTDVRVIPEWLKMEKEKFAGEIARELNSEDLEQLGVDQRLIVEFYSR
ncbi:MAG: 30S ribosomal protein S4 [Elusimicrobia bacterium CG08_land_8_20_14_0_20_44_26]|nr:MAG: 30S ribosomal protein S4 [Elusimicrobia bacterium CG08_land_8_20_14_0_20_44_26]